MQNLQNKTALVTGAGLGIGHAICEALAAAGAQVFAVARNKQNLEALKTKLAGNGHECWTIDLSTEEGQQQLLQRLESNSFPHIIVNNLHIPKEKKRAINITKAYFSEGFMDNIDHLLVIMEKTIQFQRAENYGRWIGISSLSTRTGMPGQTYYSAQKSAMESLFINIAAEEGKYGITSNIIAPGFIDTPATRERVASQVFDRFSAGNVLKRAGRPEEVAATVTFIASPGAGFITGIILPVSGGTELVWFF